MDTDKQTYQIIGAAMEVHRRLGREFLEAVYHEALAIEFVICDIPFEREVLCPITYRDKRLSCPYRADFICFGEIIVELKALDKISGIEESQVINYLKATGLKRALILNFGADRLEWRRLVN